MCELKLFAEPFTLLFRRRVVVVVVEADLAIRDDLLVLGQSAEFVVPVILDMFHLMRVGTDGGVDKGMLASQRYRG